MKASLLGITNQTLDTNLQMTPEIGIRLALGAGCTNVFRLILGQGLKVGLGLGLAGAFAR